MKIKTNVKAGSDVNGTGGPNHSQTVARGLEDKKSRAMNPAFESTACLAVSSV